MSMTSEEARAILFKIYNQINGKSGLIYGISITGSDPEAICNISWSAFVANFSSTDASVEGQIWSKNVNGILYEARNPNTSEVRTVPSGSQ